MKVTIFVAITIALLLPLPPLPSTSTTDGVVVVDGIVNGKGYHLAGHSVPGERYLTAAVTVTYAIVLFDLVGGN